MVKRKYFFTLKYAVVIVILSSIVSFSLGAELVTNGDFEQELNIGWKQITSGVMIIINRDTIYDPDPDYEACVHKGPSDGSGQLYQVVDIPSTDLDFSANVKLYAYDNHADAWAGAALIIHYLDVLESVLGATYICYQSPPDRWTNSDTTRLIKVSDSLWHSYSFNIDNELTYLPGINPLDVRKIKVSLCAHVGLV